LCVLSAVIPNPTLADLLEIVASRVAKILAAQQPAPEPQSPWLTVDEVAEYAKLTPDAVRGAEKRGKLRAHRSETGRVRFLRSDVDAFLSASQS
jgi:excisionase family DNA binding protein